MGDPVTSVGRCSSILPLPPISLPALPTMETISPSPYSILHSSMSLLPSTSQSSFNYSSREFSTKQYWRNPQKGNHQEAEPVAQDHPASNNFSTQKLDASVLSNCTLLPSPSSSKLKQNGCSKRSPEAVSSPSQASSDNMPPDSKATNGFDEKVDKFVGHEESLSTTCIMNPENASPPNEEEDYDSPGPSQSIDDPFDPTSKLILSKDAMTKLKSLPPSRQRAVKLYLQKLKLSNAARISPSREEAMDESPSPEEYLREERSPSVEDLDGSLAGVTQETASIAAFLASNDEVMNTARGEYRECRDKLTGLVFENECYQQELRTVQRQLLKLSSDRNFLIQRIVHHEHAEERPIRKKRRLMWQGDDSSSDDSSSEGEPDSDCHTLAKEDNLVHFKNLSHIPNGISLNHASPSSTQKPLRVKKNPSPNNLSKSKPGSSKPKPIRSERNGTSAS